MYYLNYSKIYKVEGVNNFFREKKEAYILYNPHIHYWIEIDETGKEILDIVDEFHDEEKIMNYFIRKYSMSLFEYNDKIASYLEYLVEKGLLFHDECDMKPDWTKIYPDINNIVQYD